MFLCLKTYCVWYPQPPSLPRSTLRAVRGQALINVEVMFLELRGTTGKKQGSACLLAGEGQTVEEGDGGACREEAHSSP